MKTHISAYLKYASTFGAALTALSAMANAEVLFSDDFTGVDASVMPATAGLNADGWYFVGSTGGTGWTTATDNTAPLSATTMKNPGGSSTWQYGLKQFTTTTLSMVGDSLTFAMDYHMGVDTTANIVGISLLNSPTTVTDNSFGAWPAANTLSAASGYTLFQNSKTTATTGDFSNTVNGIDIFSGAYLGTTSGSAILGATSMAHTLELTLIKVLAGTELTWSVDGTVLGSLTNATYDTFNTVRLFTGGNTPVYMDNISVTRSSADVYGAWATTNLLTVDNNGKSQDPDADGQNNLGEFAFNSDPLSGSSSGKIAGKAASVGGAQVLTLTLPVRTGAVFSGATEQVSAPVDGIVYRIQGSDDLNTFALVISEVTGADATAIQAGLPTLSTGWTYRTFRTPGTMVDGDPQDFIRARVND